MIDCKFIVFSITFMPFRFHLRNKLSRIITEACLFIIFVKEFYDILKFPKCSVNTIQFVCILAYDYGTIFIHYRIC